MTTITIPLPLSKTSSHYPVLIRTFEHSTGDVLELGTGLYSTPLLHWLVADVGRKLISYENDPYWIKLSHFYHTQFHELYIIKDWDKIEIEREWGLVFIDHNPPERRVIDAIRVAQYAKLVVIHDNEPKYANVYHFERLDPYYQYRYDYKKFRPFTSVYSNFDNLGWLHD
jgi:hypothetical protein